MRDIPFFTTENGVGSLTLEEIPYKGCAYVRVQAATDSQAFLRECAEFCIAVGAQYVFAAGLGADQYPFHTSILQMYRNLSELPYTDAVLCLVKDDTLEQWREIYNLKMRNVSNAATMSIGKAQKAMVENQCYFVHEEGQLIGIGMVTQNTIAAIASLIPGCGMDVMLALCHAIEGEAVTVDVASTNNKAVNLYKKLGFVEKCCISKWYKII